MGPNQLCVGGTAAYLDTPAALGATWTSSNATIGTIDSLVGNFSASTTNTGTVTITYGVSSVCYMTQDVVIRQIGAINGPSQVCESGTAMFTDTAAGGTWSVVTATGGSIDPVSGAYTAGTTSGAVVIDYTLLPGCSIENTITIDTLPVVAPISGATHVDSIWSITLTDGTTGGHWYSSDSLIAKVDSATGVVTGVSSGVVTITYVVTNVSGCSAYVTYTDTVVNAAGVAIVNNDSHFGIFPNPANGTVYLTWSSMQAGSATVQIADMTGKKVYAHELDMHTNSGKAPLSLSGIVPGVYLITVQTGNGYFCTKLEITE
jgi:hypothetical protein